MEFPEAVANELTLRRALHALVEKLLARPERADRAVRKLALVARLVGGGSWRRTLTLRDATADPGRLRTARFRLRNSHPLQLPACLEDVDCAPISEIVDRQFDDAMD